MSSNRSQYATLRLDDKFEDVDGIDTLAYSVESQDEDSSNFSYILISDIETTLNVTTSQFNNVITAFDVKCRETSTVELYSHTEKFAVKFYENQGNTHTIYELSIMEAIDNSLITVDEAVEKGFTMQISKEYLLAHGYTDVRLYLNHQITIEQLLIIGFNVRFSSTSGDPHIFPCRGEAFELPHTPGIYRLLQADNIIINASTRPIREEEKLEMVEYFRQKDICEDKIKQIVKHGCFYDTCKIMCGKYELQYDFDSKRVTLGNQSSRRFFNIKTLTSSGATSYNKYERCEAIGKVCISFQHDTYGLMCLELNHFSNPQIKYGLSFISSYTNIMSGLFVQEYDISSMKVKDMNSKKYCEEKPGINEVMSNLCIV